MGSRVLLLDDDQDVLDSLGDLVRFTGATCVAVRSLAELIGRRDEVLACDRAILDVNLGRDAPSGLDAYGWLRAEGFAGTVVFLTGHALGHPLVERACATDGTRLAQKPLGLPELRSLIAASPAACPPL